jgi:excisionase family DNA binding protein
MKNLRVKHVAEILGCSPAKVRAMAEAGLLPAFNVGTTRAQWRFPEKALIAHIEKLCQVNSVEPEQPVQRARITTPRATNRFV